jgi:uncharacterized protein (DUF433 family)
VTSARFAQRSGLGREGEGADRQPVECSKSRVGHGGLPICGLVTAQGARYCIRMSATEISSHIRLDERGVAWIDQTRVKVIEVAMDWLANRSSAEEMHLQYPHLSVAQIHAALAFYHDHKEDFDKAIAEGLARTDKMAKESLDSPGRRKLRALGLIP